MIYGMLLKVCVSYTIDAENGIILGFIKTYSGFCKKLDKLGKQKDCKIVAEWQKSIINHLYWCVSSTPADDGELVKAKWLSVDNHIHNVHRRHGKKFTKCAHGRLGRRDKSRKWLQRRECCLLYSYIKLIANNKYIDTKPSEKLTSLITNNNHLKDMTRLSSAHQTSALESFHNVVIQNQLAFLIMG